MNAAGHWLSRITPKPEIGYKQMAGLGDLDSYGQHQALCRLFHLPPKEARAGQPAPFLFRAEQQDGLPVFYVLSAQCPQDRQDLWQVEAKRYTPNIQAGDRLAFKLRGNPTVTRHTAGERGRRHDVVMDAKQRMGWKNLPGDARPTLAQVAYEAGACWFRDRQERLGVQCGDADLRVDGYRTWRQRNGKGIALSTLDFEGHFRVIDSSRFLNALIGGIGPAKAFGCGLLLVRRI
ncbi:type I-E CRISPR-associated protein Cas6/Cse3/CasE [Acidithiobacillus sulfuriphilus]|uniref:Type I-E CRISPR-associated protein Cas6/Cse3/CasE n=2 Tax=Acidithiobacillus sulfuriphilus TaxID=1867749 RepID=A0A3M8QXV0_9PROT|nr:type I-E CRISPR-associated protein Cas6/Cse3/CasE [Acidithiobacillus sulfuriphilus]RNF59320.1 type I-E CRISPR-associated protein Cas6/Cse3/CasE [Acidithiobacillus sulfuriphilus]